MTQELSAWRGGITAIAHSNIALIKYWGKRDVTLNLPAAGSISMTLGGLNTRTTVLFDEALRSDELWLNGQRVDDPKMSTFLDRVRRMAGRADFARVKTANDFPTAAGLASSASGFAALALAATRAAGLSLEPHELSILARLGSGSAARSIFGGFAEMSAGQAQDGQDSFAHQLAGADHWDLRCLVTLCAQGPKKHGSTDAMIHTAQTSPYYEPWIDDVPQALDRARAAILSRDFDALAQVSEESCLRMHASAMAAGPGILYWRGVTVELMHLVRELRAQGMPCFFTIDAGPHVKVFCLASSAQALEAKLREVDGVLGVLVTHPGQGAWVEDEHAS